jgi:hypothetical protein
MSFHLKLELVDAAKVRSAFAHPRKLGSTVPLPILLALGSRPLGILARLIGGAVRPLDLRTHLVACFRNASLATFALGRDPELQLRLTRPPSFRVALVGGRESILKEPTESGNPFVKASVVLAHLLRLAAVGLSLENGRPIDAGYSWINLAGAARIIVDRIAAVAVPARRSDLSVLSGAENRMHIGFKVRSLSGRQRPLFEWVRAIRQGGPP